MKVAVIGCAGGMGRYFGERLVHDGHQVVGHDVRTTASIPMGVSVAKSNKEAARGAEVVILAVPTDDLPRVSGEVASSLGRKTIVVEISSIKNEIVDKLKRAFKDRDVQLLSIHPMFGPSSKSGKPKVIVLGDSNDVDSAKRLFPWADLIPMSPKDHDRYMAYALNLVHIANLAFAATVAKEIGVKKFDRVSSPFGSTQMSLAKAILSDDPALFAMIQSENPHSAEAIESFIEESKRLLRVVKGGREGEFAKQFAALSAQFPRERLEEALDAVYAAFG